MAESNGTPASAEHGDRELKIEIVPGSWVIWEGTRADLDAEGLVPRDFEWPPEGRGQYHWECGGFSYLLFRIRPAGMKGPMRVWTNGDWWRLRCTIVGENIFAWMDNSDRRRRDAIRYWSSDEGIARLRETRRRYDEAWDDDRFQRFKAAVLPQRKKRTHRA